MKKSEADKLFRQAVSSRQQNDDDKAEKLLQKIITELPAYQDIHYVYNELGIIALDAERLYEAQDYFEKVIQLNPRYADPWCNLGCLYGVKLDYEKALYHYEKALGLTPNDEVVLSNVLKIYLLQHRWQEVFELCQETLRLNPRNLTALKGLGDYYQQTKDWEMANKFYQKGLKINPDSLDIYYHLGDVATSCGQMTRALDYYTRVLHAYPDRSEPYNQVGRALLFLGKNQEARENFEKALACGSDKPTEIMSNILLAWNYEGNTKPEDIFQRHLSYNEFFRESLVALTHNNEPVIRRKLKIGYVSADFRGHPVAFFIIPVLTFHDHTQVEIICYSNVETPDAITAQIKNLADGWRDINQLPAEEIAKIILQDKIDILVDLSGHTAGNMLPVFALKPAPVQVTWLGYPNTTGLVSMDYRITDAFADPVNVTDTYHSEALVRMPRCFLCYAPIETAPECKEKVHDKHEIIFACFNNFAKATDEILNAWCQILLRIPGSKLVFKSLIFADKKAADEVMKKFMEKGIELSRVSLLARDSSTERHLERYNEVDIALDTYPYHGTTTTCEALYMGVPVVTIAGDRHASRVGVSLLSTIGAQELIVDSVEAYVDKACELALDVDQLRRYKLELRSKMKNSSLMDAQQFTADLENEYKKMWATWCQGQEKAESGWMKMDTGTMQPEQAVRVLARIVEKIEEVRQKLQVGMQLDSTLAQAGNIIEQFTIVQNQLATGNLPEGVVEKCTTTLNDVLRGLLSGYEKSDTVSVQKALLQLKHIAEDLQQDFQFNNQVQASNATILDSKSLLEKINQFPFWYHKIELPGGIITPGWAPLNKNAYRIPEDLTGMRVLDVGAWDGFWTFEALKRGAKQVVAIDDFSDFLGNLNNSDRRAWETFDLCKEALGYSDEQCQRYDMSVYDISKEKLGEFEIVFFFGTLYHLRHPLLALDKLSSLCKKEIYVETAILDDYSPFQGGLGHGYSGNHIVAEFYSGTQYGSNDTNWWVPTMKCLAHLVFAAGFGDVTSWKLTDNPQSLPHCRGFARGKKV